MYQGYGFDTCGSNICGFTPSYGYGFPMGGHVGGYGGGFALIVVLFILLIIIGASYCK